MLFFVLRATCAICVKNLGKIVVFAHQEFLRTASVRACESMKKFGKIDRWSLQHPPRSVFDPSKIDRGALQDAKTPTSNENERSKNAKCAQQAPKSEKQRQHGSNIA